MKTLLAAAFVVVGTATLLADPPLPQKSGWNIEVADATESGACTAVKIVGSNAYVAFGEILFVMDISNLAAPVRIGYTFLSYECSRIVLVGHYLYCTVGDYPLDFLQIVDISDPTSPSVIGMPMRGGRSMGADGNYLYVGEQNEGGTDSLLVYDISIPTAPVLMGSCRSDTPSDLIARDGFVYVSESFGGVQVVDASDPFNPSQIALVPTGNGAQALDIAGNYVYAIAFFSPGAGLYVIDVSTPSASTVVKYLPLSAYSYTDIQVQGNHAFVLGQIGSLRVFDLTDPENPLQVSTLSVCSLAYFLVFDVSGSVAAIGRFDYATGGVCFADVGDPSAPTHVSSYETLPGYEGMDVAGDHLVFSLAISGLMSVNRYDPSLWHLSELGTGHGAVAVRGNYAYAKTCDQFNEEGWLEVFNLSDPTEPARVGVLTASCSPRVLTVGASHVYFGSYPGVWIVDVSDPSHPTKVSEVALSVRDLFADEPYLYAATSSSWRVIDVANPSAPVVVTTVPIAGGVRGVWVDEQFAYLATSAGLQIVNVADPLNPSSVGLFSTAWAGAVKVRGPYAYVTGGPFLRILDVSDAASPTEVANIETYATGRNFVVAPPYIYEATEAGLLTLQTDFITAAQPGHTPALSLKQNYPNPFNPSTTIAFELPSTTHARVDILDVNGTLVSTVLDEAMPAGTHSVKWDGRDRSGDRVRSGVYFYRLTVGGRTQARKMVLLK